MNENDLEAIEKEMNKIEKLRSEGIKDANLIKQDIIYILKSIVIGVLIVSFLPIINILF